MYLVSTSSGIYTQFMLHVEMRAVQFLKFYTFVSIFVPLVRLFEEHVVPCVKRAREIICSPNKYMNALHSHFFNTKCPLIPNSFVVDSIDALVFNQCNV